MTPARQAAAQRGIATLLILIFIGIALTVAVLGAVNHLRSGQEQGIAFHSQTLAQARAWTAAEILREYLQYQVQDEAGWTALKAALATPGEMDLQGLDSVAATLTLENPAAPSPHVVARITATAVENSKAESTSVLEVVYRIEPPGGAQPPPSHTKVIDFHGEVDIASGTIRVVSQSGDPYEIYVDGNVSINNLTVDGIDTLRSTKSIKFTGGSSSSGFKEMHANCDVSLSGAGGFTVDTVKATRNACLAYTVNSNTIAANGSVEVSGGKHGDIYAHANQPGGEATCSEGAVQHCTTLAVDFGVKTNPTPEINAIYSKRDVVVSSSTIAQAIHAERDLKFTCTPSWGSAYHGRNYEPSNCSPAPSASKLSSNPPPSLPVGLVGITPEVFDVNTLRSAANYVFSYTGGNIRVKIRGIQGIPDYDSDSPDAQPNGYYLTAAQQVPSGTPFYNGLCKVPNPVSMNDCLARIGVRDKNNPWAGIVISHNGSHFVLNGGNANASMAPGIAFFEGNVLIEGGAFTNTFIATGNITLSANGSGAVFAPNYVGPATTAIGNFTAVGVCSNDQYAPHGLVPTGFCGEGGNYDYSAHGNLGNYALLAGSCSPPWDGVNDCTSYVGGDIQVQKTVYGVVKAGNAFQTTQDGTSVIHGYVSGLGQRSGANVTLHDMKGSTTIYLDPPHPGYNPSGGLTTPGTGGGPGTATLQWSRYL